MYTAFITITTHVWWIFFLVIRLNSLFILKPFPLPFWISYSALSTVLVLTIIMFPQIIRLMDLVKVPTKSTRAGRAFGGPVKTRHCGLEENLCEHYTNIRKQFNHVIWLAFILLISPVILNVIIQIWQRHRERQSHVVDTGLVRWTPVQI